MLKHWPVLKTVAAANKLTGWGLRTFRRRTKHLMLTIWKTLVQPKLDYCSVLWSPSDQGKINKLESVCRNFSSQILGLEDKDYWERLASLQIYSQERRRERYSMIFVWKISRNLVKGYNVEFEYNSRRGRLAAVHPPAPTTVSSAVRRAREASLQVKGSRLFNLLPPNLRGMDGTVEQFKAALDGWLSGIPDQPTISDRQRPAITNSLLDQVPMHHQQLM